MRLLLFLFIALWLAGCESTPTTPATPATPSTATPAVTPSATPTPDEPVARPGPRPAKIKASILSDKPESHEDREHFPVKTGKIYLKTTPKGLPMSPVPKANLLLAKAPLPGKRISDADSRTLAYEWSPPEGGWPPGQAIVEITLGRQILLERVVQFGGKPPSADFEKPEEVILTDDLSGQKPSAVFSTTDQDIYLIVSTYKLPRGTAVRSVWIAREVEQLEKDELVAESVVKAPGPDRDVLFAYSAPPNGFHPGEYEVDIYFGGKKVDSRSFWIKSE